MIRGIVVGIVLAILVISIAFVIYRDALGPIPTQTIRTLAQFYLWNTYN
ncbi:MAG TPA: sodium:proton antiporter, partial [Ignisphaera sp.]|nr:sodium:proton antiporter [Ignisphaera sp.]